MSYLDFPIDRVLKLCDHAEQASVRRPLHDASDTSPALWCVGDHGVYLMSNGRQQDGTKPEIVYAEGCNPEKDDDWFSVKSATFGGDDGVDAIETEAIREIVDQFEKKKGAPTHFSIEFEGRHMTLVVKRRMKVQ